MHANYYQNCATYRGLVDRYGRTMTGQEAQWWATHAGLDLGYLMDDGIDFTSDRVSTLALVMAGGY